MSRMIRFALLLVGVVPAGLAAQVPDSARAAADTARAGFVLEPLEVTVERERSAPPPVVAITVDPELVQRSQAADPYLMLRQVAGVEVHDQGQGPGFASNVVMRGFTSDHSSDVLLVIDGVPVNLPAHGHVEGYADWNVLMSSAVSSLRVLHGNASPLYGDFALAGAVEVFTRAEAEGTEALLGTTSFGDVRGAFTTGTRGEDGGSFLALEGRRQEGWRNNSDYWLTNGLLRGWRSALGGQVEGGLAVYGTEWSSPGFLSVPDFNDGGLERAVDDSDGGRSRRAVLHGRLSRPLTGDTFLQVVGWTILSDYALFLHVPGHSHGGGDGAVIQSGEWDERAGVGGHVELGWARGDGGDVVFGVGGRYDDVAYRHAATLDRRIIDPELDLNAEHASVSAYGRWRQTVGERLGLDLGARLDVFRHRSRSALVGAEEGWITSNNTVFSPKLGLRYALGDTWSLHASSSRGFRSPVGIVGDPTRDPYLSWSHEIGLEWERGALDADLALFRVDVDNERVQDPVSLQTSGAGSSTRQGIDGRLAYQLDEDWLLEAEATWNHARLSEPYADAHSDHPHEVFSNPGGGGVTEDSDAEPDTRVPGLAEYSTSLRVTARLFDDVENWAGLRVYGPHLPIGEPGVETQPYSVLDAGATIDLGSGWTLDVEAQNLLGIKYVELRSGGYVTPGAPRSLSMMLRATQFPF